MSEEYKGYNIKSDGTFGMKIITTAGPGSVPAGLKGSFSNSGLACKAIDMVLAKKANKKVVTNDEANSTS